MTVKEAAEIIQKYEALVNEARRVMAEHWSDVFRRME
jgi:hypothetical protein